MKRKLITKIIEHIPQTIHLRSDIHINISKSIESNLFWEVFTGKEYNCYLPNLININFEELLIIDAGASIGMFTLWIESLIRNEVLNWNNVEYLIIEAGSINFNKLEDNITQNLKDEQFKLINMALGKKNGSIKFYESKTNPFSNSLDFKQNKNMNTIRVEYCDITNYLKENKKVFLKMDIEGAEFEMIKNYKDDLSGIYLILLEWHHTQGDVEESRDILIAKGFKSLKLQIISHKRSTELFIHETNI